jgi:hypothetical protein
VGGHRHRLPTLIDPGSERFDVVLQQATEMCDRVGTQLQRRDGYGIIEVQ